MKQNWFRAEEYPMMEGESTVDYTYRICKLHDLEGITWDNIAEIINTNTGSSYGESKYRKNYQRSVGNTLLYDTTDKKISVDSIDDPDEKIKAMQDLLFELKKERVRLSDERVQNNAHIRRLSREESIIEIAKSAADKMAENYPVIKKYVIEPGVGCTSEAILVISDWHYGIEVSNLWNKYNPDIAKERIAKLIKETIEKCELNNIRKIHVVNLSDLISGRIHTPLRIESRMDVITQVMEVSEIVAQMLVRLEDSGFLVEYYDCSDNHSRIEPNKKESLDLESLTRITHWYLSERFNGSHNITINANDYDDDMIVFNCLGHMIGGVHGNKDKQNDVVKSMTLMTHCDFSLILTAHRHHFSADEQNECVVLSNGSMMGTDSYAKNLRLTSIPSQNLVIVTPENVTEVIYKINLSGKVAL